MGTMPAQRPGRSKQDYQTPLLFLEKVRERLHIDNFCIDLAASHLNSVAPFCYTIEDDSLAQDWFKWSGWCWLNPPFSKMSPWVAKAVFQAEMGAKIAMLVPASTGSNWWAHYVHDRAHVLLLNGRLTFMGCDAPYPKDTALLLYTPFISGGYEVWDWSE